MTTYNDSSSRSRLMSELSLGGFEGFYSPRPGIAPTHNSNHLTPKHATSSGLRVVSRNVEEETNTSEHTNKSEKSIRSKSQIQHGSTMKKTPIKSRTAIKSPAPSSSFATQKTKGSVVKAPRTTSQSPPHTAVQRKKSPSIPAYLRAIAGEADVASATTSTNRLESQPKIRRASKTPRQSASPTRRPSSSSAVTTSLSPRSKTRPTSSRRASAMSMPRTTIANVAPPVEEESTAVSKRISKETLDDRLERLLELRKQRGATPTKPHGGLSESTLTSKMPTTVPKSPRGTTPMKQLAGGVGRAIPRSSSSNNNHTTSRRVSFPTDSHPGILATSSSILSHTNSNEQDNSPTRNELLSSILGHNRNLSRRNSSNRNASIIDHTHSSHYQSSPYRRQESVDSMGGGGAAYHGEEDDDNDTNKLVNPAVQGDLRDLLETAVEVRLTQYRAELTDMKDYFIKLAEGNIKDLGNDVVLSADAVLEEAVGKAVLEVSNARDDVLLAIEQQSEEEAVLLRNGIAELLEDATDVVQASIQTSMDHVNSILKERLDQPLIEATKALDIAEECRSLVGVFELHAEATNGQLGDLLRRVEVIERITSATIKSNGPTLAATTSPSPKRALEANPSSTSQLQQEQLIRGLIKILRMEEDVVEAVGSVEMRQQRRSASRGVGSANHNGSPIVVDTPQEDLDEYLYSLPWMNWIRTEIKRIVKKTVAGGGTSVVGSSAPSSKVDLANRGNTDRMKRRSAEATSTSAPSSPKRVEALKTPFNVRTSRLPPSPHKAASSSITSKKTAGGGEECGNLPTTTSYKAAAATSTITSNLEEEKDSIERSPLSHRMVVHRALRVVSPADRLRRLTTTITGKAGGKGNQEEASMDHQQEEAELSLYPSTMLEESNNNTTDIAKKLDVEEEGEKGSSSSTHSPLLIRSTSRSKSNSDAIDDVDSGSPRMIVFDSAKARDEHHKDMVKLKKKKREQQRASLARSVSGGTIATISLSRDGSVAAGSSRSPPAAHSSVHTSPYNQRYSTSRSPHHHTTTSISKTLNPATPKAGGTPKSGKSGSGSMNNKKPIVLSSPPWASKRQSTPLVKSPSATSTKKPAKVTPSAVTTTTTAPIRKPAIPTVFHASPRKVQPTKVTTTTTTSNAQPMPPTTKSAAAFDTFLANPEATNVGDTVDPEEGDSNKKTQLQHMVDFLSDEEASYHYHREVPQDQQQQDEGGRVEPIHYQDLRAASLESSELDDEDAVDQHPQQHCFEASDVLLSDGSPIYHAGGELHIHAVTHPLGEEKEENSSVDDYEKEQLDDDVEPPKEPSSESYNPNDALETTSSEYSSRNKKASDHQRSQQQHDSSFESEGTPLPPKRTLSAVKAASYYATEF